MSELSWAHGRIAHDAYVRSVYDQLVVGGALPTWDELTPNLRHAWASAAEATVRYYVERKQS